MLDIPVMKKQFSTDGKENEDDKTVLACKIKVTRLEADNEPENQSNM